MKGALHQRSAVLWFAFFLSFALLPGAEEQTQTRHFSPAERMQTVHLRATHQDVDRLRQQRRELAPVPGLHDFKAILHAHAQDSEHTGGTRMEMLAAAKRAGVQAILLSDHYRPPRDFIRDSWRGLHDGVLFIPGSEVRGFLIYPIGPLMDRMKLPEAEFISAVTQSNGLIFLSHPEERLNHGMEGLTGMEIYNRHADANKDKRGLEAIGLKLLDRAEASELQANLRAYPDEIFAAQVEYPGEYMAKWDAETINRRLTGVAANDCHHNVVFVLKMLDQRTVRLGTIVDKEQDMERLSAESYRSIPELTKGHQPGDELGRIDLDPYERSFRNISTHILAPELTESNIRSALQQGHAYVSHDWMCEGTGFSFTAVAPAGGGIMGDEVKFIPGTRLQAQFPVRCDIRLLLNGKVLVRAHHYNLEFTPTTGGVYRVEGWLKLDGEERGWIYSNPIYLR